VGSLREPSTNVETIDFDEILRLSDDPYYQNHQNAIPFHEYTDQNALTQQFHNYLIKDSPGLNNSGDEPIVTEGIPTSGEIQVQSVDTFFNSYEPGLQDESLQLDPVPSTDGDDEEVPNHNNVIHVNEYADTNVQLVPGQQLYINHNPDPTKLTNNGDEVVVIEEVFEIIQVQDADIPADTSEPGSQDQSLPPHLTTSSQEDDEEDTNQKGNERCRAYRKRKKQEQTEEESLLRDLETKNKYLKLTHGEISMKVKLFKDWYIQAIKTGKVRISS